MLRRMVWTTRSPRLLSVAPTQPLRVRSVADAPSRISPGLRFAPDNHTRLRRSFPVDMTAHDVDGDMSRECSIPLMAGKRCDGREVVTEENQGSLLKRADGLCLFITEEKVIS